jgi:hypothetical protein
MRSGIFLQERYEVRVLDSFDSPTSQMDKWARSTGNFRHW